MTTEVYQYNEDFKEKVAADVHGNATPEDLQLLNTDTKLWLNYLNALSRDVEIQLSSHNLIVSEAIANNNDDPEFYAKENKWRIAALRFKASIEAKILHVKYLRSKEIQHI